MRTPRTARRVVAAATAWSTAAAGAVALSFTLAPTASAGEFLANGGFETGSLSPWSCAGGLGSITNQSSTGSYALAGAASASDSAQCSQTVTVKPSTAYSSPAGSRARTSTWAWTVAPAPGPRAPAAPTRSSRSASPPPPSQTSATVYTHGWYGQGTYYADDLSLDGPGAPSPSPSLVRRLVRLPSPAHLFFLFHLPLPPSPSPTSPPSGLPKHALVGYLHASFANGSGYMRMADVPDELGHHQPGLRRADLGDLRRHPVQPLPGQPSARASSPRPSSRPPSGPSRPQGKKVLISIGGQNGQVQLTTTAARDTFVSSVSAIIDKYGLDGLDIDFEGHSLSLEHRRHRLPATRPPRSIVNLISALKTLKARYGARFVLTMAPETFFVQLGYQFYGSGPWAGQDPRAGVVPAGHPRAAQRPDPAARPGLQLRADHGPGQPVPHHGRRRLPHRHDRHAARRLPGRGQHRQRVPRPAPPTRSPSALPAATSAGNGYTTPAEVHQGAGLPGQGHQLRRLRAAAGPSPNLRGLMTWSINWDRYNGVGVLEELRQLLRLRPGRREAPTARSGPPVVRESKPLLPVVEGRFRLLPGVLSANYLIIMTRSRVT